jgi:iron complex outermembrane receptor protein
MLVMFSARAQYSGSVTDAGDKSTLPGAVIQAGSMATTMTDMNGKWSLDVPEGTEIKVSFVGYISKKITLGKEKNIKTALSYDQESSTLEEVVVVGYGVQKKSNVTGAISSVKAEDFGGATIATNRNSTSRTYFWSICYTEFWCSRFWSGYSDTWYFFY